jgi:hypothetical protein
MKKKGRGLILSIPHDLLYHPSGPTFLKRQNEENRRQKSPRHRNYFLHLFLLNLYLFPSAKGKVQKIGHMV